MRGGLFGLGLGGMGYTPPENSARNRAITFQGSIKNKFLALVLLTFYLTNPPNTRYLQVLQTVLQSVLRTVPQTVLRTVPQTVLRTVIQLTQAIEHQFSTGFEFVIKFMIISNNKH